MNLNAGNPDKPEKADTREMVSAECFLFYQGVLTVP